MVFGPRGAVAPLLRPVVQVVKSVAVDLLGQRGDRGGGAGAGVRVGVRKGKGKAGEGGGGGGSKGLGVRQVQTALLAPLQARHARGDSKAGHPAVRGHHCVTVGHRCGHVRRDWVHCKAQGEWRCYQLVFSTLNKP